jgi:itaconate CoA-transferase
VPDLASDTRFNRNEGRVRHSDEVEQRLSAAAARLPTASLVARLERAGIAYASVNSVEQVLSHPQLASQWAGITAGDRPVDVLLPPARHSGFGPVLGPVSAPGRDTAKVLAELAADADPAGSPQEDQSK